MAEHSDSAERKQQEGRELPDKFFARVPEGLHMAIARSAFSTTQKLLALHMLFKVMRHWHLSEFPGFKASMADLARELGTSRATVGAAHKALADSGLVWSSAGRDGKRAARRIELDPEAWDRASRALKESGRSAAGSRKKSKRLADGYRPAGARLHESDPGQTPASPEISLVQKKDQSENRTSKGASKGLGGSPEVPRKAPKSYDKPGQAGACTCDAPACTCDADAYGRKTDASERREVSEIPDRGYPRSRTPGIRNSGHGVSGIQNKGIQDSGHHLKRESSSDSPEEGESAAAPPAREDFFPDAPIRIRMLLPGGGLGFIEAPHLQAHRACRDSFEAFGLNPAILTRKHGDGSDFLDPPGIVQDGFLGRLFLALLKAREPKTVNGLATTVLSEEGEDIRRWCDEELVRLKEENLVVPGKQEWGWYSENIGRAKTGEEKARVHHHAIERSLPGFFTTRKRLMDWCAEHQVTAVGEERRQPMEASA